ncbi:MAG: DUF4435 domain-containing protein [Candidatus Staskawiczbacteria bacterium]|nr:DUF4435 domain-containing protein [Candidatus Staskawiczbacteria bacterium]
MKNINFPKPNSADKITMGIEKSIIIVGANGSGKTRFGSRIEQINNPTKRISAQRYLQLSEVVQRQDFETAGMNLKTMFKNQSPVQPENDYQQVLVSIFAEESRRNEKVIDHIKTKGGIKHEELQGSVKEKVIEVWNFIFPHRVLKLENDRVRILNEGSEFSGTEMSDGEKVGLYLISQILLADENCILIIDEPELHLHKSLMVRLWNKLEEQRSDCIFVYITHDLDFAARKPTNKIIWIKSYRINQWEWKEVDSNEVIPEDLYLEIIGSRKPIIFVEGNKGSLDTQIYQSFYDGFTIIARGSCKKVIESVNGLKDNDDLHDKQVFGLIDRDFRSQSQIDKLKSDGIFCCGLNEVENLFLLPGIIELVCNHLSQPEKKEEIITVIKKIYTENIEFTKFKIAKHHIRCIINEGFDAVKNVEDCEVFKSTMFGKIDEEFSNVSLPNSEDIVEILKVYPHKGLVRQVQGKIDLAKDGYKKLVLNFLSSENKKTVLDILGLYLPDIN